jgi:predicted acylesterase/phospholipase RssA
VCAGGGVTGAVYEIGCLRALEELLDRSVLDLDLYVGVSGGAFVASMLANGVSPADMYDEVVGRSRRPLGVGAAPLFRLGLGELLRRSARAPRFARDVLASLWGGERRGVADLALSLFELLPAGLLDNSGVREFLARLFATPGRTDSFAALRRELYIVAVDLDRGNAVAFGEKGRRQAPISQTVQASTALPGLYRPVRIAGRDYVDGGVKKTAHVNLAIRHGADLVICINPLVPIRNEAVKGPLHGPLSDKGVTYVLDQALRIMLHGRMQYGMERYRAEHPEVDILLVEPARHDLRMFSYNIMRYSARRELAEHGFRSVLATFRQRRRDHARVLARHGIGLRRVPPARSPRPRRYESAVARSLEAELDRLGSWLQDEGR